jgi:hypothetical protein
MLPIYFEKILSKIIVNNIKNTSCLSIGENNGETHNYLNKAKYLRIIIKKEIQKNNNW